MRTPEIIFVDVTKIWRGQRGHVTGRTPAKTRFDVGSCDEDTRRPDTAGFNLRSMTVRTMFSPTMECHRRGLQRQACITSEIMNVLEVTVWALDIALLTGVGHVIISSL